MEDLKSYILSTRGVLFNLETRINYIFKTSMFRCHRALQRKSLMSFRCSLYFSKCFFYILHTNMLSYQHFGLDYLLIVFWFFFLSQNIVKHFERIDNFVVFLSILERKNLEIYEIETEVSNHKSHKQWNITIFNVCPNTFCF